jgi:ankyrin repeat protein
MQFTDLLKPDLEGKTAIHHILMNAHTELLDYIVREYSEVGLTFTDLMPLEGNNALHLALSASGFGKYRARCVECFRLVVNYENERVAKAETFNQ